MKNKEKQLVITTNVKINIKNEVELEADLLKFNQTKAIQRFWLNKKKWITFWTVIRCVVSLFVLFYAEKEFYDYLISNLEMVRILAYLILVACFIIAIAILVFVEYNLIRKNIQDYPAKLNPVLEIYRQNLISPFLELRREKFADIMKQIFPSADVDDIERDLDRAYNADEVIEITECAFCKFDYLIIEEQLGKSYPLFDYNWRVEMDIFLQQYISLREMHLDKNRNIVLVIKGDGLQHLIIKHQHLIKSQVYTEVW